MWGGVDAQLAEGGHGGEDAGGHVGELVPAEVPGGGVWVCMTEEYQPHSTVMAVKFANCDALMLAIRFPLSSLHMCHVAWHG